MNSPATINLLRALFVIFMAFMGAACGEVLSGSNWEGCAIGTVFGLCLVLADSLLKGLRLRDFSSATFGLMLGLVFASLVRASGVLSHLTEDWDWTFSLAIYAAFGYLGMMLAMRSSRDEFALVIPYVRFRREAEHDSAVLLDSNVIIEGKIPEICATGFLSSSLIVPSFILDELQTLADSSDPNRRATGRKGFENLHVLQKKPSLEVVIHQSGPEPGIAVDARLLQLAKVLSARLLTNDSNLAQIARLEGVTALNFNDLARALRPSVMAGDEFDLQLVKEGRDPKQAVGYLSDGSLIVVNNASAFIGESKPVVIAGTHHTGAGRIYFAELKN